MTAKSGGTTGNETQSKSMPRRCLSLCHKDLWKIPPPVEGLVTERPCRFKSCFPHSYAPRTYGNPPRVLFSFLSGLLEANLPNFSPFFDTDLWEPVRSNWRSLALTGKHDGLHVARPSHRRRQSIGRWTLLRTSLPLLDLQFDLRGVGTPGHFCLAITDAIIAANTAISS